MFIRKNGHTFGILNDFDLAVIVDTPNENQRRTGTRPFMAIDLLVSEEPIKRHYMHDAESFFWVAVYDSTSNGFVNGWGQLTNHDLGAQKASYLCRGTKMFPMKETYQPIVSWVDVLRKFFILLSVEEKDWGIDELYNTLRESRHDQGKSLAGHIKTRQEKYYAPAAS